MTDCRTLVINLGSVSTKVAVYLNDKVMHMTNVPHTHDELSAFKDIWDQEAFRKDVILRELNRFGVEWKDIDVIASRGGNMRPAPSGIYIVTETMLKDIRSRKYGLHPTGLGCSLAYSFGKAHGIPVIIADPPVTDEFCDEARFSGMKQVKRISSFHALNQKRTARVYAAEQHRPYEEMNLIVVHMGGGVSVGAHAHGKVIDVNNALDGEGPFSPERAGTIAALDLIELCFSGLYDKTQMIRMVKGNGGLSSYLGTSDAREIERRIEAGDQYAERVYRAMAYQISKEIGSAAVVLGGHVDAILLTGNLANSKLLIDIIEKSIHFIAPVVLYPGENEILALAESAWRFMNGEQPSEYPKEANNEIT